MVVSSIDAFDRDASGYDTHRRLLIPCFDTFYATVTELVGLRDPRVERVLDLGAGTGLLSERIAQDHPDAKLVLLDGAWEMLHRALPRLAGRSVELCHQDLREPLPPGPFDAIVSALAIHHLENEAKRDLLARAHERLRPGGIFVNAEQVSATTPWLDRTYEANWREQCRHLGASESDLTAAEERMTLDHCVDVQTQIGWMRESGFTDSDCFFRSWRFAVIAGWRP